MGDCVRKKIVLLAFAGLTIICFQNCNSGGFQTRVSNFEKLSSESLSSGSGFSDNDEFDDNPGEFIDFPGSDDPDALSSSVITGGKTYYVSLNGSDSNPGTITQPFKTIEKAVSPLNLFRPTYFDRVGFTYFDHLILMV
jgi:hypothetical protein